MRISDWSSDVCSSDLHFPALSFPGFSILRSAACQGRQGRHHEFVGRGRDTHLPAKIDDATAQPAEFKRLSGFQIVQHGGLHVVGQRIYELHSVLGVVFRQGNAPRQTDGHRLLYPRSEEHTSELQSLMRISYAVFCLKKKKNEKHIT